MMDVAVIGAGPAGTWTAYCLAQRGARVVLIDPSHPREKPCGGGVTARALALVSAAISIDALPSTIVRSARFIDSTGARGAVVPLEQPAVEFPPDLIVASRTEFDAALVNAARDIGVELLPSRVRDVEPAARGFTVRTDAGPRAARFIVGADGATSVVRRRLAAPFRRDQLSIATGFFAHGQSGDEIVVEFTADPAGYLWSFPRPSHLAIGMCAQADAGVPAAALRGRVAEWMRANRLAPKARLEPYSWPIPSLSADDFQELDIGGSGWFLTGDAAGLVDPITREGIHFALLSGAWAAEAIASGHPYAPYVYSDRVRAEIGSELARAARFKSAFFDGPIAASLVEALAASGAIRSVMADLIAGRQRYDTLKWRLLGTFEIGLALKIGRRYLTM